MKKLIILWLLAISFYIGRVFADATFELQSRLNKINNFHANFLQKVIKADGNLIHNAEGQLWIKRPNLFNWHIVSPDENWLISDGTNFWFYNPIVDQVTVTLLNDTTNDIPFILITRNDNKDWKRYKISQNNDNFLLTSKENNENKKYFSITITTDGTIKQFSVMEQDGLISLYELKVQQNSKFDDDKFKFVPPQGTTIDDQR
ncbi:MAG: outer membrane lipoprotein chaperone LolA [Arsenophonus sp.]